MLTQDIADKFKIGFSIRYKIMLLAITLVFISVAITTIVAVKTESAILIEGLVNLGKYSSENIASSAENAFRSLNWIYVEKALQVTTHNEQHEIIYAKLVKPNREVYLANDRKYYGELIDVFLMSDKETIVDNYYFEEKKETVFCLFTLFQ